MWYERSWQWAREHLTITVPGVALIFAATFIVMLAVNAGEVGAAWVQAVGSILGIGIAIYVPYMQKQHADRVRRDDEIQDRISSYYDALTLIDHQLELIRRIQSANLGWGSSLSSLARSELADDLQRNRREVEGLGLDALGSGLLSYLLMVKGVAGFGGFYADQLAKPHESGYLHTMRILERKAVGYLADLEKASLEIEELTEDWLSRLG